MSLEERRMVVDLLCARMLRPDFDSGALERDPQLDTLKEGYRQSMVDRLITDEEWEDACQMVYGWQDDESSKEVSVLQTVLEKFRRFPTVNRVQSYFGDSRAEEYRAALETLENAN